MATSRRLISARVRKATAGGRCGVSILSCKQQFERGFARMRTSRIVRADDAVMAQRRLRKNRLRSNRAHASTLARQISDASYAGKIRVSCILQLAARPFRSTQMQLGGDRFGLLISRELSCWPDRENRFHLTIRCRLQPAGKWKAAN